jgi:hypothetical protein
MISQDLFFRITGDKVIQRLLELDQSSEPDWRVHILPLFAEAESFQEAVLLGFITKMVKAGLVSPRRNPRRG